MSMFSHATGLVINGGIFNAIQSEEIQANMDRMKEMTEDDEWQKVMAWASSIDASAQQFDVSTMRHPGTGEWLLNSDIFHQWEHGIGRALWCPGLPGGGKTILISLVIDHLLTLQLRKPIGAIGVAWIYFNYKEELTQTPDAIHLSLIRQLAASSDELYSLLRSAYKKDHSRHPSAQRLIPDMHMLTRGFTKVFIVVDALDECAENNQDTVLEVLAGLQKCGANILITSRDHVANRITDSQLEDLQRIYIRGDAKDITDYVNARVKKQTQLARIIRTDPELHNEILKAILDSCQGMFLMAKLYIESLRKKLNARDILEALKVLPKTFCGIYDEAMHRLESDIDYSQFALQILSFIIHARRPLTVVELQQFLAVNPGDIDIDDKQVTDKDILISVCAGLVVVDDKTGIVRLVHFTAQEYFNDIRMSKFPSGDQDMGRTCLTYLSFGAFRDIESLSYSLGRYALLEYIVHYWHVHVSRHQEALRIPLSTFFKDETLLCAYSRFMETYRPEYFSYIYWQDYHLTPHTGFHAAVVAGLQTVVGWLIADGANINSKDFTGNTALTYSSRLGFIDIVELLITGGVDVNVHNRFESTGLQLASEGGHEAVMTWLLKNGAKTDAERESCSTALWLASEGGHEAIVRLLLKNGANVNTKRGFDGTTLQRASGRGYETIVRSLLENGADTRAEEEVDDTPLQRASEGGHETIVKLLLENGADVNAQSGIKGTALQRASGGGHETVVRLLLENGANANAEGKFDDTPLQMASGAGHEAIVRLLLENGADANAETRGFHGTALHWASGSGHEAIVKLLLENGADVNAYDRRGKTALQRASEGSHKAVVQLLLDQCVKVKAEPGRGDSDVGDGSEDDILDSIFRRRENPAEELETRDFDQETDTFAEPSDLAPLCRCGERIVDQESEDVIQCQWPGCVIRFFHLVCEGLGHPVINWICDACEAKERDRKRVIH